MSCRLVSVKWFESLQSISFGDPLKGRTLFVPIFRGNVAKIIRYISLQSCSFAFVALYSIQRFPETVLVVSFLECLV